MGRVVSIKGLAVTLACAWLLAPGAAYSTEPDEQAAARNLIQDALQLFHGDSPAGPRLEEGERSPRSATILLNEIKDLSGGLDPSAVAELEGYLQRPAQLDQLHETDHFSIHYTTAGADRATAEQAGRVADVCEYLRAFYHGEQGWPDVLSDGDSKTDVYLCDLGWGVYAYALHEDLVGVRGKTGFIVVENDFAGAGELSADLALPIALAHEYFHLIQFTYGYDPEANWFMEQTATWMEGEAYSEINDHFRYLEALTASPNRRLDLSDGAHEYGTWLWPRFLAERWTESCVKDIWTAWSAGETSMLAATDAVLRVQDPGMTLDAAHLEWAVWNAFLGENHDGRHYKEGAAYPFAIECEVVLSRFPVDGWHPAVRRQPEPLAANYVELRPDASSADNQLTIELNGCPSLSGVVFIGWRTGASEPLIEPLAVAKGLAQMVVSEWDAYERAWLVIAQGSQSSTCCSYRLGLSTRFSSAGIDDGAYSLSGIELTGQPNPFDPRTTISFSLPEAMPISLRIYDAQGRLLDSLAEGIHSAGRHAIRWGGPGSAAGSSEAGLYFCEIRTPHGSERLRLVRVR
jgi:hypothetical protein